jgi:periplasmic copper chaperone A
LPQHDAAFLAEFIAAPPATARKDAMKQSTRFACLLAVLLVSLACYSYAAGNSTNIVTSGGWIRATAPGQDQAGADLTIASKQSATLVGASSPVCKAVQLHTMTMEGGMMRMRQVKAVKLPAGKPVNLRGNGYHLMLIGLKAPLKEGEKVPLTLKIKLNRRGVVKVRAEAEVVSLTATGAPSHDGDLMQMKMN